jgi:hypothetical protein
VIIGVLVTWEFASLFHTGIQTLSHIVREVERPVWGRALLVCVWLLVGFAWFVPRDERFGWARSSMPGLSGEAARKSVSDRRASSKPSRAAES